MTCQSYKLNILIHRIYSTSDFYFFKNTAPLNPKQEGETCGFSRSEICGVCGDGLQCDAPWMDACGYCIKKRGSL